MIKDKKAFLYAIFLLFGVQILHGINYKWDNIANDLLPLDGKKHGQERIEGLVVASYGRCFAASLWNEMHREGTIYQDGDIVGDDTGPKNVTGVLRRGGRRSDGRDIAADDNYAYGY